MKISKSERKKNAQAFYDSTFCNRNCKRAAIVVHRTQSKTNPNVFRCQFWAVPNKFAGVEPVIIAESINDGIQGCFNEFFKFIYSGTQTPYWNSDFNKWLKTTFGMVISYNDDFVIILEKI